MLYGSRRGTTVYAQHHLTLQTGPTAPAGASWPYVPTLAGRVVSALCNGFVIS